MRQQQKVLCHVATEDTGEFAIANSSGTVAWRAAFHAFGYAEVDPSSTITNNLRLPGQYFDAETNLHYNWNRYYDPRTGRYLTPDPIGLEGGIDPFVYVDNDPVNWVDREGLEVEIGARNKVGSFYDYARQIRSWGHQQYPGEVNSSTRHCVVSCMVASKYGKTMARLAGAGNELQGLVLHDLSNVWSRLTKKTPWAFQWQDLMDNENGVRCSDVVTLNKQCSGPRYTCIECCQSGGQR